MTRYIPRPRWAVVSFMLALESRPFAREQLLVELISCAAYGVRSVGA